MPVDEIPEYIEELEEKVRHYKEIINESYALPKQTKKEVERREGYEKVLKIVQERLKEAEKDRANLPD